MNALYSELRWLPRGPEDFTRQLKSVGESEETLGSALQRLASFALDLNQLTKLAKVVAKAQSEKRSLAPLIPFRLAVLSNSTTDLLVPALIASAARHGISLEVARSSYDQAAQEALNPDSETNRSKPDAVLFAMDYRALPLKLSAGNAQAAAETVNDAIGYLQSLRDGVKEHSGGLCIFQTFAPPVELLFGSMDRSVPGTMRSLIDAINRELADFVRSSGDVLLDVAGLAETVGLADWHDPQLWNLGKFAFSDRFIPIYADRVALTIAAIRGKSRKVLVLDLDNTIWGGVLGDDGIEGIKLAQGDAEGEAYLAVQRMALDLRSRGIVLAVSSKNDDAIARGPFERHPEMLLKLEHVAVFQANWSDKATNLQAIADELSLGLDGLVLLDDNPVERGMVRQLLPQVAVPELPEEAAFYARTLAAAGYFETVTFAAEDLKRAAFYQDNAKRAELQKQVRGVDAYLASLDMTITFQPFDAAGRSRIVQLINKSNQYNVTTRRYTEPEVIEAEEDAKVFTLQVRLADRFGDNGMISVVICRPAEAGTWEIDTWLMSCRVLGRRVEHMVLREVLRHARATGIQKLRGTYLATEKNGLVADHYSKLGFNQIAKHLEAVTQWELLLEKADVSEAPMKVISRGFPAAQEVLP
ncbi:HAD-superfamily phosphatase subfamily IIIC [Candidatus Koribacter versatilis Ellin345]|uniref:HAD-superfamily phosphatase subfamily IIIC n=1 Tax=Koribacter versatilis (strain Ellin345) TaxID=204669 RepID=Q1IUN0_KORVE|nr:HAD-IIIC family phosphatase [Candidatus Koribacter versatilis]ABF39420.1 HAD-superfamily phosphatase subfamily IIIC [Candidatus Koribacter versatilis Ellin345]